MILVLGWERASYDERVQRHVADVIAALYAEQLLTSCLAALPEDRSERAWLLSLLSALHRIASVRTVAVLSGPAISPDSLARCHAAGIREAIVVQRDVDPSASIRTVREYQRAHEPGAMPIRVWLDGIARGTLQRQICAWRHDGVSLAGLELSPFAAEGFGVSHAPNGDEAPLVCEWLASTLTVSASGALLPCPAHTAQRPSAEYESIADLVTQRETWRQTLGSHPVCRRCHRLVRFVGLDAMQSSSLPVGHLNGDGDGTGRFVDYVSRDSSTLTASEREAAIGAFIARLRNCR